MAELGGIELSFPALALGVIVGSTYGLLAVGLVLVYRANKIVNFAHAEIGAVSAALLGLAVIRWHVPYWLAFPAALVVSAGLAALVEVGVIRRLRHAPKLMSVVATLGFAQFLLIIGVVANPRSQLASGYPRPVGLPSFDLGTLHVTPSYSGIILFTPLMVGALTLFLRCTRLGAQMRGAAADDEGARLCGVYATRMSTLSWALAGVLSAFTAIMLLPTRGYDTGEAFGPGLLLRALLAGLLGRMSSLPVALGAGVAIGVIEQVMLWNTSSGGAVEVALFVLILLALVVQRRQGGREEERGSWAAVEPWPALPDAFLEIWTVRNLGRLIGGAALIGAVAVGLMASNATATVLTSITAFALIGLSVGVITGLLGQLSLGQFALAGIGAVVSYHLLVGTGNLALGLVAAGLAGAGVCVVIGLPALRIRGLVLAVTTLSFAVVVRVWLLQQPWMLGSGVSQRPASIAGVWLDTGRRYYLFSLGALVLGLWLARNLRRSSFGRSLVALRDNHDGARAFTVPATLRKLQAFAVAGFLAGLGGAVYGGGLSRLSDATFSPGLSIDVVAITVIGGVSLLVGPLLGALYVIGVPRFLPLDTAELAATELGWLLLILYFPGGLAQVLRPARDRLVDALVRLHGADPSALRAAALAGGSDTSPLACRAPVDLTTTATVRPEPPPPDKALLQVVGLSKRFGGVIAVDDVSLEVRQGETLGIIGPNGAGKTTLFELIGGFTRADRGRVVLGGRDVTRATPEDRGRLGLIRSFQDASLFPTMTVLDTVRLAQERRAPTRLLASALGVQEPDKDQRARELVALMGLDAYRHVPVRALSTGTRRITELACLIALEPTVLLLDEPSSGIAQRETEALAELLRQLRSHLGTTLVMIEHDMPLIMGLSDRIVAMDTGRVLAEGSPEAVRADPRVVASYLGGPVLPSAIEP